MAHLLPHKVWRSRTQTLSDPLLTLQGCQSRKEPGWAKLPLPESDLCAVSRRFSRSHITQVMDLWVRVVGANRSVHVSVWQRQRAGWRRRGRGTWGRGGIGRVAGERGWVRCWNRQSDQRDSRVRESWAECVYHLPPMELWQLGSLHSLTYSVGRWCQTCWWKDNINSCPAGSWSPSRSSVNVNYYSEWEVTQQWESKPG